MTPDAIRTMQQRLLGKGYSIGIADGVAGARTMAALAAAVARRDMANLLPLGAAMARFLPQYGIMGTPRRLANFMGQTAHETMGYRVMREIWGPTAAQSGYEGRRDLGNTNPGDGRRYMGRGIIQVTGRANYARMAQKTGAPLLDHPELLEQPELAVQTACIFWADRGCNAMVDAGLEDRVTRAINGGTNGMAERRALVARAKEFTGA